MSHNDNVPERSAWRHRPALIAIVVALVVAALAFLVFIPGSPEDDGIATTPPPAGTTSTEAEGTEDPATAPVVPEPVEGTVPEGETAPAD
ncbi:hypothetical protein [Paracoccus siganidrum]|nr:hypothetical protein [Paracoccus siganidrum]